MPKRPPLPDGPFLVAGLGRAGQAAALALRDAVGAESVRAWDSDNGAGKRRLANQLRAIGIRTYLGPRLTRREAGWARVVVKSPGIPFHVSVIQRARAHDRDVIDELELGWRLTRAPMIGVTGTNGKSTVSALVAAALSGGGRRVRLAGNTEFGPALSAVAGERADWIVCEVSSFQLEGCTHLLPEIAVFTNLTPEHFGRHGTLKRYGQIKRRMFITGDATVARAVVDVDGSFGRELAAEIEERGGAVTRVGFSPAADYRLLHASWDLRHATTTLRTPSGPLTIRSSLPGRYNARNLAAALAVADLTGVGRETSIASLSAYIGPPGRFEHIDCGQPFEVIVDYAHTTDGLAQLLATVRAGIAPGGALRLVFGVGGPAGTLMREMGAIARGGSDRLILTTSGFRGVPPLVPLQSVLTGARGTTGAEPELVLDRRRAIAQAVREANPGDAIVIPGRGALPSMRADARGEPTPFDDREVAREAIRSVRTAQLASRAVAPQSLTSTPRTLSTARSPSRAV